MKYTMLFSPPVKSVNKFPKVGLVLLTYFYPGGEGK